MYRRAVLMGVALLVLVACGKSSSTGTSSAGYGNPGDATKADRTITVNILTSLRYDPVSIMVRPGETVVFMVTNQGAGIHEFVLGDKKTQDDYQSTMNGMGSSPMAMPDRSNLVSLQPGQTKQLVWTFPSVAGSTVIYGSHEPGDYSHLMGMITVGGTR